MIHAHSLRSGNLVLLNGETRKVSYACRYSGTIQLTESEVQNKDYDVDPIPLTVDWMAKCGFKWDPENKVYFMQIGNTVYLEYDVDFNCSIVPETWRGHPLHLWGENKHLHKLQNIYYDHTGEELEIKL